MVENSTSHQAEILAVIGASGSGKSTLVKQALKARRPGRLLIWDRMNEYGDLATACDSLSAVKAGMTSKAGAWRKRFALRYCPTAADRRAIESAFSVFCKLAYAAGNCVILAEELRFVTKPSGGPPGWVELTLTGRHRGCTVIGTSQRPAACDKDFFSNATQVTCFRLNYQADVDTMAGVLGVDKRALVDLPQFSYHQRNMISGEKLTGVTSF